MNHESRLVKSNLEVLLVVTVRHRYSKMQDFSVPHSDVVWYDLNGMGAPKNAPKKVLETLFPYIFYTKTK